MVASGQLPQVARLTMRESQGNPFETGDRVEVTASHVPVFHRDQSGAGKSVARTILRITAIAR